MCDFGSGAVFFILCYVGISGFVVVFTVLPIAKTIYEETDTPWRLYCCAGAQTVSAAYLAGSIQAGNVYATDICGTTTMAGLEAFCYFCSGFLGSFSHVFVHHVKSNTEKGGSLSAFW